MTQLITKKELLDSVSAFAAPGVPTIKDALEVWEQQDVDVKTKRRVRQDALNLCKRLGVRPAELIAHPANLNPRIRRLTEIGPKRRSNITNSIKTLLWCLPQKTRSFKSELTPPWATIAALVTDEYRLASVQCMMRYGSAQNTSPEQFDDEASASLLVALVNERLNGNPPTIHQNAVRCSNWLRTHVLGWSVPHLTPPRYGRHYIEKWEKLPRWCKEITAAFLDRSTTADPFDLSRPMKAWRPATIKTYETLLRRYFSIAQQVYDDLDRPREWRDVANFAFAEPILKWLIARNDGKRGQVMAANIAVLLAQLANTLDGKEKLAPDQKAANGSIANELLQLASRLNTSKGLSQKARSRVSPFKDEANLSKLILFPFGLARQIARSKWKRRKLALLAQWAMALMLLTFCALRISTLSRLSDRHLRWSKPGRRGDLTLELEGEMLKNGEPATVPVPRECAQLIKLFCDAYRPALFNRETEFLFPSEKSKTSKSPGLLSTQLSKLVRSRLGMEVNPHLYRHLVHIVILRRFPGAYAMVSRVLIHRSLQTAVQNYSHFDVELSMNAYHKLIEEVQNGTRARKSAKPVDIAYSETELLNASRKSSQ
ncbi:MAG: hypothetical protein ACKVP7_04185 [Hyphomicrobiaceae bacterium]